MSRSVVSLVGQKLQAPSFRLRMASLGDALHAHSLTARLVSLPRRPEWLRVFRLHRAWAESAVIVFSKLRLLTGELGFVRRRCPTWVLDVDDAIMFGKPKQHGAPPDQARWRQRRFARMVRHCRLVVAGSPFLAEAVTPLGVPVETIATPVDLRRYPVAPLAGLGPLRVAWIGLGENIRYLEDLGPVLRELVAAGVAIEVHVVSDRLPVMPGVECRLIPWSESTEGASLADCDVGLAPLPDDLWTRGKGGYRCIQYAAAGLPCVASPVGASRSVVVDGETGLWAASASDWRDALVRLAGDAELRRRLGGGARRHAQGYDVARYAERYAGLIAALVDVG